MPRAIARRRESSTGFHFVNLFQCCPRKFYFKYIKRWISTMTHQALVFGSAFHEGKAAFYQSRCTNPQDREEVAIIVAINIIEQSVNELASESYRLLLTRIGPLLQSWFIKWGRNDIEFGKILAVEKELRVPITGTPYIMTVRLDALWQDYQSGLIYILESKTSGFSSRLTSQGVRLGDQATIYLLAVKRIMGLDPYGVIPDVSYWSNLSQNPDTIRHERDVVVQRSDFALNAFERSMGQVLTELNQKVEAYRQGHDPFIAFPRNPYYCTSFSSPCGYAPFCYEDCERRRTPPDGFKLDRSVRSITRRIEDSIAIS